MGQHVGEHVGQPAAASPQWRSPSTAQASQPRSDNQAQPAWVPALCWGDWPSGAGAGWEREQVAQTATPASGESMFGPSDWLQQPLISAGRHRGQFRQVSAFRPGPWRTACLSTPASPRLFRTQRTAKRPLEEVSFPSMSSASRGGS